MMRKKYFALFAIALAVCLTAGFVSAGSAFADAASYVYTDDATLATDAADEVKAYTGFVQGGALAGAVSASVSSLFNIENGGKKLVASALDNLQTVVYSVDGGLSAYGIQVGLITDTLSTQAYRCNNEKRYNRNPYAASPNQITGDHYLPGTQVGEVTASELLYQTYIDPADSRIYMKDEDGNWRIHMQGGDFAFLSDNHPGAGKLGGNVAKYSDASVTDAGVQAKFEDGELVELRLQISVSADGENYTRVQKQFVGASKVNVSFYYESWNAEIPAGTKFVKLELMDRLKTHMADGNQTNVSLDNRKVGLGFNYAKLELGHNITAAGVSYSGLPQADEIITLTAVDVPQSKEVDYYTVNGDSITGNTFTMPAADITVGAVLKDKMFTVNLPSGENYTVTPITSGTEVAYGGSYEFSIELDAAYSGSELTVKANGTPILPESGVYTVTDIQEDIAFTVEGLVKNQYDVVLKFGDADEKTVSVAHGDTVPESELSAVPAGYAFEGVFEDAEYANEFDTDTLITQATTLHIKCSLTTYSVTVHYGEGESTVITKQAGDKMSAADMDGLMSGFTFKGFFLDSDYENSYDADQEVSEDLTLYAKYDAERVSKALCNSSAASSMAFICIALAGLAILLKRSSRLNRR